MAEFKAIESQEEFDRIIGERLQRQETKIRSEYEDYEELKNQNNALEKQINDLNSTIEASSQNSKNHDEEIEQLNSQIKGYELAQLKTRIAMENGIPYSLASRLQGDDEESILSDAKSLSGYVNKPQVAPLASTEPEGLGKDGAYKNLLSNLEGD